MSKLQDALQRLRDAHEADVARNPDNKREWPGMRQMRPADQPAANIDDDRRAELSATRSSTAARMSAGGGETQVIANKLSIDPQRLIETGLELQGAEKELIAQQFRKVKRPILKLSFGEPVEEENPNVIMIASALPGVGKTFCSFNLTESIARERDFGGVLVDADVLRPKLSKSLGIADRIGLIDYLLDASISLDDILLESDYHGIAIVPAGKRHPEATELLASRRMRSLVQTLSQRFPRRAIVFDTPPLLVTNEAHVLSDYMGQIVIVIEAGETVQDSVLHVLEGLNPNKAVNAILNKSRRVRSGSYHGGEYGYYGYGE